MKKTFFSLLMLCCISYTTSMATQVLPLGEGTIQTIVLTCHTIDPSVVNDEHPRGPVRISNVYLDQDTGTLYFESPCYKCVLELVIPGTASIVYAYSIPDGDDSVILPDEISGEYEIHIHHDNFCFGGLVELL